MSISIQGVPYSKELSRLANSANHSLKITSPYITFKGIQYIINSDVAPKIITRVTASNLSSNALDGKALKHLLVLGAEIRSIPNLHAKIYLIDDNQGIVTSSNLTASGFSRNVELGICFQDEPDLFKSINHFFSALWEKAIPVTLESLEQLEKQLKKTKFSNGIYRIETEQEEDIVPVPAIGHIVFNVLEDDNQGAEEFIIEDIDALESDEMGDFFAPIPITVNSLIEKLSSSDERIVQTVVNSLALTSREDFITWLHRLGDFRKLISPMNSYPYKRHVIWGIIKHGLVSHILQLLKSLISDISNESQLVIYFDLIDERVKKFSIEEKKEFLDGVTITTKYLSRYVGLGRVDRKKNFAKPNLDRINILVGQCGAIKEEIVPETQQINTIIKIPSFQEIKKNREALGIDFWEYSVQFFPEISSGAWNEHLPSIGSIFKELGKIKLSEDQKEKVEVLAKSAIDQIQFATDKVKQDVEIYLKSVSVKLDITKSENEQIHKAIDELARSTGRTVQLYGQWTKSNRIERDSDLKKKLDYLSTSYSIQKTVKKWFN